MERRRLGKLDEVGVIGLGVEHLKKRSQEEIAEVISEALNNGINYIDLIWSYPKVVSGVGDGIRGNREKAFIATHLGSCYRGEKYVRSRVVKRCRENFEEVLDNLDTDYVDVVNLHYVSKPDWDKVFNPGGVFDLAKELVNEGIARSIGLSTHNIELVKKAATIPEINTIMHQTSMANHNNPERDKAFNLCVENGKSIIGMKVFAKAKLLKPKRKEKFAKYITGGQTLTTKIPATNTSTKCLHYSLSQPGVAVVVPGVSNLEELHDCLRYVSASEAERNYDSELEELFLNEIS